MSSLVIYPSWTTSLTLPGPFSTINYIIYIFYSLITPIRVCNYSQHPLQQTTGYTTYPASAQTLCDSYFSMSSSSYFRRCSRVVSPAAYLNSCLDAVSASFVPSVMDMCSVAATYVRQCSDAGVPVSMPVQCS